jgi:hypothetical protein
MANWVGIRLFRDGTYAPPSPNFQTGMPSFLAPSVRLPWMPVPGNIMTPIGRTSSIASLCLNGAALACFVQSGLNAICGTLRLVAHLAAISSAPFGDPRCSSHVGMLGVDLVELVPDQAMIVEVESTGERDLRTYRQHDLGLGASSRQWIRIGRRGRCSAELALSIGDHASGRNFTAA